MFMKILESTPERYDRGIRILSHGRIDEIYEMIAEIVAGEGKKILDIGCGTGNVSLACAAKGSSVVGIDINTGMLEIAEKKSERACLKGRIEFMEIGVAEMKSRFEERSMDACVACLAFSELSDNEQRYAISSAYSILKPGGYIIVADVVAPRSAKARLFRAMIQAPVRLLAYVLTQASTRPLQNIASMLEQANFVVIESKRTWGDSFIIINARKEK